MSQPHPSSLIGDMDTMFCAVIARLRHIGEASIQPTDAAVIEANNRLCRSVLECAGALEQLHSMLVQEVERRCPLDLICNEDEAALARAPRSLMASPG